jgi:hypothetical protein
MTRVRPWRSPSSFVPPLGRLQALPAGAKPITSWPNQDEAFADVANRLRDAIVGRAALKPWLTPAESPDIDARLSVLVSDQHQELRVVGDPGATPVHRGARLQVQVTLNRPAYVYVLWVTSGAIVQPLYPWSPGDWDRYPPHATQIARSHLVLPEPDPATGPGTWSIDSDQGAETAVLLVRERPLAGDAAAALPHALAAVPSARLAHPDNVLRCEYRRRAATEMTSTRVAFDFEPTDTPFAQHTFLRTRLENRFPLMHIVSFGNAGDHRHAGP